MTWGATPSPPHQPHPTVSKHRFFWNCSWSDARCRARSMSTPWGKTYIHETQKSQVGCLCRYGFTRHYCSVLLQTWCALKPPCPRGMECLETSLLHSNLTYSSWMSQSAVWDVCSWKKKKREKKNQTKTNKKNEHNKNLAHTLGTVQHSRRRMNLQHTCLLSTYCSKLSFSHKTPQYTCTSYLGSIPAMIFCAMSINVSSYKNTLHFDKWIQNSKKDKLL